MGVQQMANPGRQAAARWNGKDEISDRMNFPATRLSHGGFL
jgi:hypothetical protein